MKHKRIIYAINIFAVIYVIGAVLLSINGIVGTYKGLANINYTMEKEYNEIINKYKEIIRFIIKNRLPKEEQYFNLMSHTVYGLLPIKVFNNGEFQNIILKGKGNDRTYKNGSVDNIIECYNNKCI